MHGEKKIAQTFAKKKGLIHDCKQAKRDFKLRLKHLQTQGIGNSAQNYCNSNSNRGQKIY